MLILESEVVFEASRSSGPGGQHVQKTSTRITIRWNVLTTAVLSQEQKARVLEKLSNRINKLNELVLHVETHRSQYRNKVLALKLLNELVKSAIKKPKARKKTRPSKGAVARRLREKSKTGEKKQQRRWGARQDD